MAGQGVFWLLVPFCVFAAAMAFAVTYGEMQHHYAGKREPLREAFRTALVVLLVFLALAGVAATIVPRGQRGRGHAATRPPPATPRVRHVGSLIPTSALLS